MLKKYIPSAFLDPKTIWLFLALTIGLFIRAYFLSQPMRGDEAYTFLTYVNPGIRSLFEYSAPNNHVLNTLLIKLSTSIFTASPASIRFPAFFAGLAAIVLVFSLARSLDKTPNAGILAAATVAIFPYLILYSTNARGYTLIVALTLVIAWIGHRFSNHPSASGVFWLALFSSLGMLAIPIMLFPVAGIFLWLVALLLIKRMPFQAVFRQFVLPFSILSILLTIIFYLPVVLVSGLAPIISNKFITPQSWNDFLTQIFPQLQKTFEELSHDVPPALLLSIFLLVLLGIFRFIKQRNWAALLLLPSFFIGACLVLLIQHTTPYARTWIYLIPFIILPAEAGLLFLLEYLPRRAQTWINPILLVCAVFFAVNLASKNSITAYPDTSAFPEAPIAVQYLKPIFKPGDTLRISPTADWSVYFYFWYDGMSPALYEEAPSTGRIFFIRKKSRGPLGETAAQKFTLLLDVGDMVLYQGKK